MKISQTASIPPESPPEVRIFTGLTMAAIDHVRAEHEQEGHSRVLEAEHEFMKFVGGDVHQAPE
jgi:hypothetical protein